ncbi:MAG TPA: exodeoxyribonuclease V subunit alpha [Candidatus Binataceae bacterium]|nr:exodeoxyribonuclease V subunit alpha [Candidatus Binataceae bacterium]
MTTRYASLGLDTAWRRFETARGGAESNSFEWRMRALETALEEDFGLAPDLAHLAAEIASFEPNLGEDDRFALIILIMISIIALEQGSTRIPAVGPLAREPMRTMLRPLCGEKSGLAAQIEALLESRNASAVIGYAESDSKPLLFISPYIFHHRILHAERAIASRIAAMLRLAPLAAEKDIIAAVGKAAADGVALSQEQRAAVAGSARSGLTVISGGPGTGKTTIVGAIVQTLAQLGVDPTEIALAAPTGKAAFRMGECVRAAIGKELNAPLSEPATIHRLIGYSAESGRCRHHPNNPLSAAAVIVDEGSMLGIDLMERLINAMAPDARLIILGDADQLPSVAAGAVFRDLAAPGKDDTSPLSKVCIRLAENHRMKSEGGAVYSVATEINRDGGDPMNLTGSSGKPLVARRSAPAELEFQSVEFLKLIPHDLERFLDRWYDARVRGNGEISSLIEHEYLEGDPGFDEQECVRLQRLFAYASASRILCVTRVFETGAERINLQMHERAARTAGVVPDRSEMLAGEPIIVLRNDFERGLFNGDQGIILWVRRKGRERSRMAVFPRGDNFAAFRLESIREITELSYAMTVHKAQGSEFDSVALVLPEDDIPLLTREIIYTAVSRGRRSAAIVGDDSILMAAIGRRAERFSGLRERIGSAAVVPPDRR